MRRLKSIIRKRIYRWIFNKEEQRMIAESLVFRGQHLGRTTSGLRMIYDMFAKELTQK